MVVYGRGKRCDGHHFLSAPLGLPAGRDVVKTRRAMTQTALLTHLKHTRCVPEATRISASDRNDETRWSANLVLTPRSAHAVITRVAFRSASSSKTVRKPSHIAVTS